MIAGLVKAPSNYAPTADAAAARGRARARIVLGEMVEYGAITPAQAAAANPDQVQIARPNGRRADPLFHRLDNAAARHPDRRRRASDRRVTTVFLACRRGRTSDHRHAPKGGRARWSASIATARCGRWSAASIIAIRATIAPRRRRHQAPHSSSSSIPPDWRRPDARSIVQDARSRSAAGAPALQRPLCRPIPLRRRRSLTRINRSPCASPSSGDPDGRGYGAGWASRPGSRRPAPSMALELRGAADRLVRAYAVGRGGVWSRPRHPPVDDRGRHAHLPASGRSSRQLLPPWWRNR